MSNTNREVRPVFLTPALLLFLLVFTSSAFAQIGMINPLGQPPDVGVDAPTFAIWKDPDGLWHLRWRTGGLQHAFSGTITAPANGRIHGIRRVGLETEDTINDRPSSLSFQAKSEGPVEGFDFQADGPQLDFTLYADNQLQPGNIYIGAGAVRPAGIPFSLSNQGPGQVQSRANGPRYQLLPGPPPDRDRVPLPGYALWRDDSGWHLRWGTALDPHKFSGALNIPDGEFSEAKSVNMEKGDILMVKEREITFDTTTTASTDGIDFRTTAPEVRFYLMMDGGKVDPRKVHIGQQAVTPMEIPFVAHK